MRKPLIPTLLFCMLSIASFGQSLSIPIYYTLALNKSGDKNDLTVSPDYQVYAETYMTSDYKRKDFTFTRTKFDSQELHKLYSLFVSHIKLNKTVKSYTWNGFTAPALMGLFKDDVAEYLSGKDYQKVGELYVYLQNSPINWNDSIAYNQDSTLSLDAKGIYSGWESVLVENQNGEFDEKLIRGLNTPDNLYGIGFTETWTFDSKGGKFAKSIYYTNLHEYIFSNGGGDFIGSKMKLNFKTQSKPDKKNLLKENMVYDVFFDQWNTCDPYNNENNSCENVQGIAYSGNANGPYISGVNRGNLLLDIFSAINNHKITALNPLEFENNKGEKAMTIDEMYESLCSYDSVKMQRYDNPELYVDTVIKTGLQGTDVCGIKFIEDWYLEPKTFNFYKKVKYFAVLATKYDKNTGYIIGSYPLFYIKPN